MQRALAQFAGIWEVLLAPERVRIVRLLFERIDYGNECGEWKFSLSSLGIWTRMTNVTSAERTV